jgi:hypothetical protein
MTNHPVSGSIIAKLKLRTSYLNTTEVMEILRRSRKTLCAWVKAGDIPAVRVGRDTCLIRGSWLSGWKLGSWVSGLTLPARPPYRQQRRKKRRSYSSTLSGMVARAVLPGREMRSDSCRHGRRRPGVGCSNGETALVWPSAARVAPPMIAATAEESLANGSPLESLVRVVVLQL